TQPIVLCFGGDAAGEAATLRGMELAAAQGFEVRVVPLPAGLDPADLADGFEQRIAEATTYLLHRVRLEVERAPDRQEAFVRAREVLSRFEDSPERQRALRFVADRLDLPKETQAGLAPRGDAASTGSGASVASSPTPIRRERSSCRPRSPGSALRSRSSRPFSPCRADPGRPASYTRNQCPRMPMFGRHFSAPRV